MQRLVQHPVALIIQWEERELDIQAPEHTGVGQPIVQ
jgi:hypothetical protein